MATLTPSPKQQFIDASGVPYSGGKLYTYAAGTTTPLATYSDADGTPNTNPVILDTRGEASIWLSGDLYKFVLKTADDVTVWSQDKIRTSLNAASISADDGASGTLWTTVQGFINKILSSVGSSVIGFLQAGTGAVTRTVQDKVRESVSVMDFGAVGDGITDDTLAFQKALDNGRPFTVPVANYLITDSLMIDETVGCDIDFGCRTVANRAHLPRVTFRPATKRDVFVWKNLPAIYAFAAVKINGLSLVGSGPGATAVFNLPRLYRGRLDAYIYTGIDHFAIVERWLDCKATGNINGFRVSAFRATNSTLTGGNITTRTNFDVYISGGAPGYTTYAYDIETFSVHGAKLTNIVESVDCAVRMARGNTVDSDIYTENVPRTNTGALFEIGKINTGDPDGTTVFVHNGTNLHGTNASAPGYNSTLFADIGWCSMVAISNVDIRRFGALIATTADSKNISFTNTYTIGVDLLEFGGSGIYDFSKLTFNSCRFYGMAGNSVTFLEESIPVTSELNPNGSGRYPRWRGDEIYSSSSLSFWKSMGDGANDWRLDAAQTYTGSAVVSPGMIAAGASYQSDVTVTGALGGDWAVASWGALYSGITVSARVTAADTVTVTLTNVTGSPIVTTTATLRVMVTKVII